MSRRWFVIVVVSRADRQIRRRADLLGLVDEALELDVGPEVEDLEAAGLEHRRDEVLADIVDVALDRSDDDPAAHPGADVAALELGFEDGHGRFHGLGAGDELGQEIFALLPELADPLDARDVAPFDDFEEVQPGLHRLGGEPGGRLAVPGDDGFAHPGKEIRVGHGHSLTRIRAMARVKAGVVPQHPPTNDAPAATISGTNRR